MTESVPESCFTAESCSTAKNECRLCSATKEIYKTCAIEVIDTFLAFSARFLRRQ